MSKTDGWCGSTPCGLYKRWRLSEFNKQHRTSQQMRDVFPAVYFQMTLKNTTHPTTSKSYHTTQALHLKTIFDRNWAKKMLEMRNIRLLLQRFPHWKIDMIKMLNWIMMIGIWHSYFNLNSFDIDRQHYTILNLILVINSSGMKSRNWVQLAFD